MFGVSDGELDQPGLTWTVEFDCGSCGHQHRSLRAAQYCYRRIVRAADLFRRRQPIAEELVELVGDLTRDELGFRLLGIRGYTRNDSGHLEWTHDGWVSDFWARGQL